MKDATPYRMITEEEHIEEILTEASAYGLRAEVKQYVENLLDELKFVGFQIEKFAPFIHGGNILDINKELNDAIYHIERNGNAKIVLLDLSIKLTRLLHTKEAS